MSDDRFTSPALRPSLTIATQEPDPPMFEVVGDGTYDADTDTLTYSQRALQPLPEAPRMFYVAASTTLHDAEFVIGSEIEASGVPGRVAELFNQLVAAGHEGIAIQVEEQPF